MRTYHCDVLVVGGGTAGIAAALSAAETGSQVMLIERQAYFGGNATNAQVSAFCGFYTRGAHPDLVVGGVGKQVLDQMEAYGMDIQPHPSPSTGNTNVKFDPELIKIILDEFISKSSVEALLHTSMVSVERIGDTIDSVLCSDDEGLFTIQANQYIDTTGNASLIHLAECPTLWGNEEHSTQQVSLVFRIGNLPKREISNQEIVEAIRQAKADGIVGLKKEQGMIIKRPEEDFGFCTIASTTLSELSSQAMTQAEMELRQQIKSYMQAFRQYIKGCKSIQLVSSGPVLGLRETRHIIAETQLIGTDILSAKKRKDSIGRAAWSPEIHSADASVKYIHIPDNEYASIPLGSLKVKHLANVWAAGRVIGADSVAFASIRVMGTGFVTGQAAGVAAALSCKGSYDLDRVQQELNRQGAFL